MTRVTACNALADHVYQFFKVSASGPAGAQPPPAPAATAAPVRPSTTHPTIFTNPKRNNGEIVTMLPVSSSALRRR
ncbi:hypothetical protein DPPLL_31990 [Desulfofustis limnaeus]|uniref:Uncharacterized protein n=1 Tax=Desulfofustis limnaeus TaxID=2740163 RepID=A0ABM7WCX1_9BACT|nr:hypothetical protein DPPLL_31990 [Desulfofustis limnaeus]